MSAFIVTFMFIGLFTIPVRKGRGGAFYWNFHFMNQASLNVMPRCSIK